MDTQSLTRIALSTSYISGVQIPNTLHSFGAIHAQHSALLIRAGIYGRYTVLYFACFNISPIYIPNPRNDETTMSSTLAIPSTQGSLIDFFLGATHAARSQVDHSSE